MGRMGQIDMMKNRLSCLIGIQIGILLSGASAFCKIQPDKVYVADSKKTGSYKKDGIITGGDRMINDVIVRDIRRAPNKGFERIVIDLAGTRDGEPVPVARPPYYQLALQPEQNRVIVSIWGNPRLDFDSEKVRKALKKSQLITHVDLFPGKLEQNLWTFALNLKPNAQIEAFELSQPVRLIIDILPNDILSHSGASSKHPSGTVLKKKASRY